MHIRVRFTYGAVLALNPKANADSTLVTHAPQQTTSGPLGLHIHDTAGQLIISYI
jgi:hypothetical protein